MLYFSATAGGFFDDAISTALPDDARPITAENHAALLAAQASGMVIRADARGHPFAAAPSVPPALLQANLRRERDALLSASDWSQFADAPLTAAQRAEWRAYRKALRDLPGTTPDLAAVAWPAPPA